MAFPKVISLTGDSGVGKDTVGMYLGAHAGYVRVAFADAVRDALEVLDPLIPPLPEYHDDYETLSWWLENYGGWDVVKALHPYTRQLMQRFGIEVGRETLLTDLWVQVARRKVDEYVEAGFRVVITDARFFDELNFVRLYSSDTQTWLVENERILTGDPHRSENEWREWSPWHPTSLQPRLGAGPRPVGSSLGPPHCGRGNIGPMSNRAEISPCYAWDHSGRTTDMTVDSQDPIAGGYGLPAAPPRRKPGPEEDGHQAKYQSQRP